MNVSLGKVYVTYKARIPLAYVSWKKNVGQSKDYTTDIPEISEMTFMKIPESSFGIIWENLSEANGKPKWNENFAFSWICEIKYLKIFFS